MLRRRFITLIAAFVLAPTVALAALGDCSQPATDGPMPSPTDCLTILRAAVNITECEPECICAPKGRLPAAATDALICLRKATGLEQRLRCPCGAEGFCGDGVVNGSEECDEGGNNSDASPCTGMCTIAVCGDGLRCFLPGCASGPSGGTEMCDGGDALACPGQCQPDCSCP